MFKHILAALFALAASVAMAASVDANKATQAELEGIKGVGPVMAGKILDERKKGAFKNWDDLVERVKGIGEGNAAKFSAEGLTVGGAGYKGAAAAAAPKKDDKPAATATAKKDDKPATPAAPAAPAAKKDDKPAVAAAPAAAKAEVKKDAPAATDKADAKTAKADKPKAADAAASGAKK